MPLMKCIVAMRRPPARYPPIIRSTTAKSCRRCWCTAQNLATIIPPHTHRLNAAMAGLGGVAAISDHCVVSATSKRKEPGKRALKEPGH